MQKLILILSILCSIGFLYGQDSTAIDSVGDAPFIDPAQARLNEYASKIIRSSGSPILRYQSRGENLGLGFFSNSLLNVLKSGSREAADKYIFGRYEIYGGAAVYTGAISYMYFNMKIENLSFMDGVRRVRKLEGPLMVGLTGMGIGYLLALHGMYNVLGSIGIYNNAIDKEYGITWTKEF